MRRRRRSGELGLGEDLHELQRDVGKTRVGSAPVFSSWGDAEVRLELLRLRRAVATPSAAQKKLTKGQENAPRQGQKEKGGLGLAHLPLSPETSSNGGGFGELQ